MEEMKEIINEFNQDFNTFSKEEELAKAMIKEIEQDLKKWEYRLSIWEDMYQSLNDEGKSHYQQSLFKFLEAKKKKKNLKAKITRERKKMDKLNAKYLILCLENGLINN